MKNQILNSKLLKLINRIKPTNLMSMLTQALTALIKTVMLVDLYLESKLTMKEY